MLEINVNELRVGSVVGLANFMDFKAVKVTEIRKERVLVEGSVGIYSSKNHKIIPIELSEEWLLKAGFKRDSDLVNSLCKFGIWFNIINMEATYLSQKLIKIKYVHQLQNLFFSLVGEELVFFSTET